MKWRKLCGVCLFSLSVCLLVLFSAAGAQDVLTLSTATTGYTTGSNVLYFSDSSSPSGGKRFVQVFVVDPDEKVLLKDSILYKSEQFFTDETDQELRHTINVTKLLEQHNAKRTKMKDKTASLKFGRDIYLESVKLRDLRMVVSTIAKF